MDFATSTLIWESVIAIVVFILGRLVQSVLNKSAAPYVEFDENDSGLAGVYIYRWAPRGHSDYEEYKLRQEDGRWKPVIRRESIFYWILAIIVLLYFMACYMGIKESLCVFMPPIVYAVTVWAVHYYEAHRVLMKEFKNQNL